MKILYLIVIVVTAFAGCAKKEMDNAPITTMNKQDTIDNSTASDPLNYLALGDSYTIGESVPDEVSFPYQLMTQINLQKHPVKIPTIIAVTGWTTDRLIEAIASSDVKAKKYDFVTLLIGVNDQFQGLSQDNYKVKFQQVLNTAIDFVNGNKKRVFVLSIPDYGVTPFAGGNESTIGPKIDQFNAINKDISLKAGVNYLDITEISRQAATDPTLIANDGLHPSGKMYGLWVSQLTPLVIQNLK